MTKKTNNRVNKKYIINSPKEKKGVGEAVGEERLILGKAGEGGEIVMGGKISSTTKKPPNLRPVKIPNAIVRENIKDSQKKIFQG